ncbi:pyruvate formate lyase family protein [Streptomyces sp. NPDC048142]|uniref:pyruvate formate lyase family protein n=1 Tax=Streptomyces sp. NPDC048142 TaxID=3365501 RepID=UPI00372435A3
MEAKHAERAGLDGRSSTADVIRDLEELAEQVRALGELTAMATTYGCDVSRPAATAHEAVQWLYLGYWTDDESAVDGLAALLSGPGCVERVDVLPFHKLGAAKYDALGVPLPLRDTPIRDPALVDRVRGQLREHGLAAH